MCVIALFISARWPNHNSLLHPALCFLPHIHAPKIAAHCMLGFSDSLISKLCAIKTAATPNTLLKIAHFCIIPVCVNLCSGRTRNVAGSIEVNGEPRDLNKFGRQACYIMQENELRPLLTAREAMTYAAKLKLGGGSHSPSNKAIGLQVRSTVFSTLVHLQK